jgi:hypothetical protein
VRSPLTQCLFPATVGLGRVRNNHPLSNSPHSTEAELCTITVSRPGPEQAVYSPVKQYEIKDRMLTLAFDDNHDEVMVSVLLTYCRSRLTDPFPLTLTPCARS